MSDQTRFPPRTAIWAALPLALLALALVWLFAFGGFDTIARSAAQGQREAQTAMAGGLRGLKSGQAGAFLGLMAICFTYGFFHAAGPGHGKVLIGGMALAGRGTARRLAVLALLSSLGQAVSAILLVGVGFWLLGWGRDQLTGAAEALFAQASWVAILLLGLWLVLRATRRLLRLGQGGTAHDHNDHHHDHHHHHDHAHCTHDHGPSPEAAAQVTSVREAAVLIGVIAIRPCTGAVFVLLITHAMGVFPAGIAGTFAMALGTASVTILVALVASWSRGAALDRLGDAVDSRGVARTAALVEGAAGALIAAVSISLLLPFL
ncbi:nickel/cobalt transporter [Pseudooceanicola sp. LIPI14-2-Ac024]|uniref:nickel/cobalt transporter n=1 Tax=Pseudooceanicola sp. LIPI14-2-Ac024 TaxID=3344875 RepID=UPI0035CF9705